MSGNGHVDGRIEIFECLVQFAADVVFRRLINMAMQLIMMY